MALLFGFACGQVGKALTTPTKKSVPVVVDKAPMTSLISIMHLDAILPNEETKIESDINLSWAHSLTEETAHALITVNPTYIGDSYDPFNTS